MKYDKKIGKQKDIDTSNQLDTDTNRSRQEQNYMNRAQSGNYDPRQRNEDLEKSTDNRGGEGMYYYEPQENLHRFEMSPVTEGRQTQNNAQRSPTNRQSVIKTVKHDLNERTDLGRNPIQTLSIQIPLKKNDQNESSPKTIYLGNENIFELNTRTRDRRMSPNQQHGYMIDKPNDNLNNYRSDDDNKKKPIQIEMPINNINKNKMSPNRNIINSEHYDGREIDEEVKKKDKRDKLEKLKNMQSLVYYNNEDDNIEKESEKSNYDNLYKNYGEDMKKLSQNIPNMKEQVISDARRRKQTGFTATKNEGKLINQNIESMKPYAENFNDRHTVIQKMNKLSTILMSRSVEPTNRSSLRTEVEGAQILRDKDLERKTFSLPKSPQQKFIRFTMAMLSSKGIIKLIK